MLVPNLSAVSPSSWTWNPAVGECLGSLVRPESRGKVLTKVGLDLGFYCFYFGEVLCAVTAEAFHVKCTSICLFWGFGRKKSVLCTSSNECPREAGRGVALAWRWI